VKVENSITERQLGPRPTLGIGSLSVLALGYAAAIFSGMGPAAGLFIVAPTIGLAALLAVVGMVRKERPIWPALLTLSFLAFPICMEWLGLGKEAFEWLVRQ
jgi:hypothetical protein